MIIDSSVWIGHLRHGDRRLQRLLESGVVLMHPFIIGELACGNLVNREELLGLLGDLPQAVVADNGEALGLVEREQLQGRGIGWVDVHLLASAMLTAVGLWTHDRRLAAVAAELGVGAGTRPGV